MEQVVHYFKTEAFRSHPIWILLGEIDDSTKVAKEMISSVTDMVSYYDVRWFELSKSTLNSLNHFLSLHPINYKIGVCTMKSQDEFVNTALLKRIEDIPERTTLILLSQNIPTTLYSRGLVFNIPPKSVKTDKMFELLDKYDNLESFLQKIDDYTDMPMIIQLWFEKKILNFIQEQDAELMQIAYKVWNKILDLQNYLQSGQATVTSTTEMMLSVLEVSGLFKRDNLTQNNKL